MEYLHADVQHSLDWIGNIPHAERQLLAAWMFPDLAWLGERTFVGVGYLGDVRALIVEVGKSRFYIGVGVVMTRGVQIYGLRDWTKEPYRIWVWRDENSRFFTVKAEHAVSMRTLHADVHEFWAASNYSTNGHTSRIPCWCDRCRRIEHIQQEIRREAEKIDLCVRHRTVCEIRDQIARMKNQMARFTFCGIWLLKWRETGNVPIPRDILRMVLGLL